MNPENKTIDKDKKEADDKKSSEAVETPSPPQHMDPSKKPATETNNHNGKKAKK